MPNTAAACPLCAPGATSDEIWRDAQLRVIDVPDGGFPGYTRVVWHQHIAEMTDLPPAQRDRLMHVVWQVESALRSVLAPHKVNLAQFGNQVPHLHWHIIPRWPQDTHFPDAAWAPPAARSPKQQAVWQEFDRQKRAQLPAYHTALRSALNTLQTEGRPRSAVAPSQRFAD